MARNIFIPARSSRHRVAVLALYRALLKTGSSIPLPKELHRNGHGHPITNILRTRFAKNKPLTSLRLVYDSMTAGYKFLTLLTKGLKDKSPEHSEILRHVQKRNETAKISRSTRPLKKSPPTSKQRRNPPLLTKISAPGEYPKYEPTVRPLPKTAFVGERKVPVPGYTAEYLSFLRIKKPQPAPFSRALGERTARYRQAISAIKDIDTEHVYAAAHEDLWDGIMHRLLYEKGVTVEETREGPLESFRFSVILSKAWWEMKIFRFTKDSIARSEALSRLVEQERALAKEEKQSGLAPTDPKVAKETLDQILTNYRRKQAASKQEEDENGTNTFHDPFMSPKWLTKVAKLATEELGRNERTQARQSKKIEEFRGEDEQPGTQKRSFYEKRQTRR